MTREYTPDDIRRIGDTALPAIAASYDELNSKVTEAKSSAEATFGSFIPGDAAEQFNILWGRFATMADRVPESTRAMGETLVAIADQYDEDEAAVVIDLQEAMGTGEEFQNRYMDELDE